MMGQDNENWQLSNDPKSSRKLKKKETNIEELVKELGVADRTLKQMRFNLINI